MSRTCTVCRHPEREDIDAALVRHEPFRAIARRTGLHKDALIRHHDNHLPKALLKARDVGEVAHADNILGQIRGLRDEAHGILTEAKKAGDLRTALGAIREGCRCLELIGRVAGELRFCISRQKRFRARLQPY